ncbi:MAG: hypothetical protein IKS22_10435 [Bacteroidales bacterium]|nr:hypothetical protein [Bacteroidales bacterium]
MSVVKIKDKRNGVTYVYEQDKGVYDPETKQTRTHRVLIGKIDPSTGEMVPTRGWGKNRMRGPVPGEAGDWRRVVNEMREDIGVLRRELAEVRLALARMQEAARDGGR